MKRHDAHAEFPEYTRLTAAELGDTDGLNVLADFYRRGTNVPQDLHKAFQLYTRSAQAGSAAGAYGLGECYWEGSGTDRDPALAAYWFQKAAEGGDAMGMFALGCCYLDGIGIGEDAHLAQNWFQQAADTGMAMARAMANASTVLFSSQERACEAALAESVSWLMLLAESGEPAAAYLLARFYGEGICLTADAEQAFYWYDAAAKAGSMPAMRTLAKALPLNDNAFHLAKPIS